MQRPEMSRVTAGPEKTFSLGPIGKKILNFTFLSGTFQCTLYFRAMAGRPNVAGPGITYPLSISLPVTDVLAVR